MSDSDSDGGPGLDDFMWGNLGEGDRLEVDYMPQVQQQAACSDAVRQHRGWLHRVLDYVSYPSLGHSVCAICLSLHSQVLCRSRQQLLLFLSFVPSSTSAPRSLNDLNASTICQGSPCCIACCTCCLLLSPWLSLQDAVGSLKAVANQTQLGAELQVRHAQTAACSQNTTLS